MTPEDVSERLREWAAPPQETLRDAIARAVASFGGSDGVFNTAGVQSAGLNALHLLSDAERALRRCSHVMALRGGCHWRVVTPRVEYVESEGDRRTWTLWQDGRQVGHVRMRLAQPAEGDTVEVVPDHPRSRDIPGRVEVWNTHPLTPGAAVGVSWPDTDVLTWYPTSAIVPQWAIETSRGIAREALGLPEPDESD